MQSNYPQYLKIDISLASFIKFFIVVGLLWAAWILRDLMVAMLVSILIATPTSGLADKLQKFYVPRGLTAFTVLALFIGVLVGVVVLFVPVLSGELSNFSDTIPQFQVEIRNFVNTFTRANDIQQIVGRVTTNDVSTFSQNIIHYATSALGATASAATSFIVQLVIIFVLTFYFAVQEKGVERFLRLISPKSNEDYVVDLWERSQKKIQSWINGQLLLAAVIGVITYVALTILGMQHALLFGLLAAVCEIIPIVGMTIATIPAVLIGYLTGGFSLFIKVLVFYLILGQLENHVLSPIVVGKVVGIPSIIVIISLLIGGMLAGFWGVLLAVPIAAIVMEFVEDVEKRKAALPKVD